MLESNSEMAEQANKLFELSRDRQGKHANSGFGGMMSDLVAFEYDVLNLES